MRFKVVERGYSSGVHFILDAAPHGGDQRPLIDDKTRLFGDARLYEEGVQRVVLIVDALLVGQHVRIGGVPVSYTHLDVYKRQGFSRSRQGRLLYPPERSYLHVNNTATTTKHPNKAIYSRGTPPLPTAYFNLGERVTVCRLFSLFLSMKTVRNYDRTRRGGGVGGAGNTTRASHPGLYSTSDSVVVFAFPVG